MLIIHKRHRFHEAKNKMLVNLKSQKSKYFIHLASTSLFSIALSGIALAKIDDFNSEAKKFLQTSPVILGEYLRGAKDSLRTFDAIFAVNFYHRKN